MKLKILSVVVILGVSYGLVRAVELFSQIARYQKYWNNRSLQSSAENDNIYIALGDSTAQGVGATTPQKGYVSLIANHLDREEPGTVRIINLSKSGAKLQDVLERQLPELEAYDTSKAIITMQIGSNDMSSYDPAEFERRMSSIMRRLPKHTVVGDIPFFGGGRHRSLEPKVLEANKIIHKLARQNNLSVAKIHDITEKTDSLRNYAIDFFHPSNRAYKFWAEAFLREIKEIDTAKQSA